MAYPSKFQRAEKEMYRPNGIQLSEMKKEPRRGSKRPVEQDKSDEENSPNIPTSWLQRLDGAGVQVRGDFC